ncbi:MAG: 2-oxoacid:acceptor oxidoreductase family protein [Aigarchaeota archaeon]|nr:2-oxoacid:acceptor oxidoreductase family protein [Aigarchaeota archaeon]MCX8193304.1 2-oxoacid:acceptor oxidoreductase family protein [Nitrososphaeria archaeon]MDW7986523.1 2-oxoacid:acceptor oxidoreductase family protein [Nitrososphaerota archaeon]
MIEIRWHGRGGQGVVTVSDIMARSIIMGGKYAQHFPEFGPERSGAPVKAFTRISDEPIEIHSGVYNPDIVVIIDEGMSKNFNLYIQGLKENGLLFLNLGDMRDQIKQNLPKNVRVYVVNAKKISYEEAGKPIFNIPMLGGLVKVLRMPDLNTIEEVLSRRFPSELFEVNIRILRRAYEEVESIG